MLKKILLLFLIPFLICSCTKESKNYITFASWGSVTETGIIKKLIHEFETENPDTHVQFIHIPQNYFQKIHLMFASNTPPDVIFLNNLYLPIYAHYLEDLTEYANPSDYYSQTIEGLSMDNKLLGLPRDISNLVLYVNLDKINLPRKSWTLNNLLDVCKSINKNNFCISYEDTLYWVSPYFAYFGGGILDKDSNLIIDSENSQ